jgi:hypothetical protein
VTPPKLTVVPILPLKKAAASVTYVPGGGVIPAPKAFPPRPYVVNAYSAALAPVAVASETPPARNARKSNCLMRMCRPLLSWLCELFKNWQNYLDSGDARVRVRHGRLTNFAR